MEKNQKKEAFEQIFSFFKTIIDVDVDEYENNRARLVLPLLPFQIVEILCEEVTSIFREEAVCLDLPHNLIVVGDIHGHILDLFRILKQFGLPPTCEHNYLFLGDIVDRGEFSTETICLIFIMKVLWPNNIFIIRGNHEFAEMCQQCGFSTELFSIYGNTSLESAFLLAFAWIPLSAIINNSILCVHGGIGPQLTSIDHLKTIQRPLYGFDGEPAASILWSDPLPNFLGYKLSTRGSGYFFGEDVLVSFLKDQMLELLIRGHECVEGGVQLLHGNYLTTVFSASYYCGISPNRSGVLILSPNGDREVATFPPLNYFKRSLAHHKSPDLLADSLSFKPPIRNLDCPESASRVSQHLPHLLNIGISPEKKQKSEYNTGRPTGIKINRGLNGVKSRPISVMSEKRMVKELRKAEGLPPKGNTSFGSKKAIGSPLFGFRVNY